MALATLHSPMWQSPLRSLIGMDGAPRDYELVFLAMMAGSSWLLPSCLAGDALGILDAVGLAIVETSAVISDECLRLSL